MVISLKFAMEANEVSEKMLVGAFWADDIHKIGN